MVLPVPVKKAPVVKQLSMAQQIDAVYDEVHKDDDEVEKPAEGFIGRHMQKLKQQAKAKDIEQSGENGLSEYGSITEQHAKTKKGGILARAQAKLEAEELKAQLVNETNIELTS